MFKGSHFNYYIGGAGFPPWEGDDDVYLAANPAAVGYWAWPYRKVKLAMEWNDTWISSTDRDLYGLLDRHYGFPIYISSGVWLTNHQSGENEDGANWNYFVKIVAVPADAVNIGGI